ncbi:MAG: hypothetical protein KDD22_08415, partial [Bdellovibrionales bacterium]|nr:hypothetical protein [Bdellovibrionales bacterium]
DLNGKWVGAGSCYLSHSRQSRGACDYQVTIESSKDQLTLLRCVVWHQEWGDGRDCTRRKFEIYFGNELWKVTSEGSEMQGYIEEREIRLDHPIPGGFEKDTYSLDGERLHYDGIMETSGMQWLHRVELSKK